MTSKKRFRFVLGLFISVGLLFAVARVTDLAHAMEESREYPWSDLVWVLLISLCYYFLKALRWHYFLSVINIRLPFRRSIFTYFAGQWFALSPAGEFVRAYLLVPYGYSFSRGSAAVSIQVLLDLLSLAVVGSVAVAWFRDLASLVLPFTALLAIVILAVYHGRRLAELKWVPFGQISKYAATKSWSVFFDGSYELAGWRSLLVGLALGTAAVWLGSVVLFLISRGFQIELNLGQSVYVYTIAQLAGALSMLPHGLGAMEASSVALYGSAGADTAHAASAVVLFRLCTVGWGLVLGGVSLLCLRTRLAGPSIPRIEQSGLMSEFTKSDQL